MVLNPLVDLVQWFPTEAISPLELMGRYALGEATGIFEKKTEILNLKWG